MMTSLSDKKEMMGRSARLLAGFMLSLCAPLAVAQNNLGELLDAGSKKLSVDEFKQELVQRVIIGPTATGGTLEVIYATGGAVQGSGKPLGLVGATGSVNGEWRIDADGRICTTMTILGASGSGPVTGVQLPSRCQWWFRLGEQYFLSDSDTDRHARVLLRTIKK